MAPMGSWALLVHGPIGSMASIGHLQASLGFKVDDIHTLAQYDCHFHGMSLVPISMYIDMLYKYMNIRMALCMALYSYFSMSLQAR